MTEETPKMYSIWYFVGWILLIMGGIILISGIYYLIYPTRSSTVLQELHPDLWWGAIMVISGGLFLLKNRKP